MDQAELEKMMREAERRMNEMHAKAHGQESAGEAAAEEKERVSESPPPAVPSPVQKDGGILKTLLKDKDKTIILALMFLLYSEGGDYSLLLALLYLLMD